jgi:hypothetical protein
MTKDKPGFGTIAAGAIASGAAFFVLTRLGLFGTVTGAVVASIIYIAASHWIGRGLERGKGLVKIVLARHRAAELPVQSALGATHPSPEMDGTEGNAQNRGADGATEAEPVSTAGGPAVAGGPDLVGGPAVNGGVGRSEIWRRTSLRWAPAAVSVLALVVSAYIAAAGPLERVVVREVVRENPVVTERVVVERDTVTVTVTVPDSDELAQRAPAWPGPPVYSAPPTTVPSRGGDRRTVVADAGTQPTTTTVAGSTTTTTLATTPSTSSPPTVPTTAAPPASTTTASPPPPTVPPVTAP